MQALAGLGPETSVLELSKEFDDLGQIIVPFWMPKARMKITVEGAFRVVYHTIADVRVDEVPPGSPDRIGRCFSLQGKMAQIDGQTEVCAVNSVRQLGGFSGRADNAFLFNIPIKGFERDM